jgi:hypothetical protein
MDNLSVQSLSAGVSPVIWYRITGFFRANFRSCNPCNDQLTWFLVATRVTGASSFLSSRFADLTLYPGAVNLDRLRRAPNSAPIGAGRQSMF